MKQGRSWGYLSIWLWEARMWRAQLVIEPVSFGLGVPACWVKVKYPGSNSAILLCDTDTLASKVSKATDGSCIFPANSSQMLDVAAFVSSDLVLGKAMGMWVLDAIECPISTLAPQQAYLIHRF